MTQHETTLPVSKKKIVFRAFTVREEKILLLAAESELVNDPETTAAIIQVLTNCTLEKIDVSTLATADVEWLFIQIRKRSVGEIIDGTIKCPHCQHLNQYGINLDKVEVVNTNKDKNIVIDSETIVTMKYPTISSLSALDPTQNEANKTISTVASMIEMIAVGDQVFARPDVTGQDIEAWLLNLTKTQVDKLNDFIETIPKVVYADSVKCTACGGDVAVYMEGLEDFFI